MPAPAIAAFEARYAVPVLEGYGLTESTVGATLNPLDGPRRPGSVGRAMPGVEVAIAGDDGGFCPAAGLGAVVIRGGHVMTGQDRKRGLSGKSVAGRVDSVGRRRL